MKHSSLNNINWKVYTVILQFNSFLEEAGNVYKKIILRFFFFYYFYRYNSCKLSWNSAFDMLVIWNYVINCMKIWTCNLLPVAHCFSSSLDCFVAYSVIHLKYIFQMCDYYSMLSPMPCSYLHQKFPLTWVYQPVMTRFCLFT